MGLLEEGAFNLAIRQPNGLRLDEGDPSERSIKMRYSKSSSSSKDFVPVHSRMCVDAGE